MPSCPSRERTRQRYSLLLRKSPMLSMMTGIFEELALEDGLGEDGVEFGVALLKCAGETVTWGVQELRVERAGKISCCGRGESGGEEGTAAWRHVKGLLNVGVQYGGRRGEVGSLELL